MMVNAPRSVGCTQARGTGQRPDRLLLYRARLLESALIAVWFRRVRARAAPVVSIGRARVGS